MKDIIIGLFINIGFILILLMIHRYKEGDYNERW